jgi:Ni,Fe-hydrogenase III small subunit/Pyruvate/2-oxoacid:ferredoxin oxidoreductase delta subunit
MLKEIAERCRQGQRTVAYPKGEPVLPDRFRGLPVLDRAKCPADCRVCAATCPLGACAGAPGNPTLDLGVCLFCGDCASACPTGALRFTREHRLAAWTREDLVLRSPQPVARRPDPGKYRLFHRSLKLRQVSAGGCNACEADINVLSTVVFDIGRFGLQVVASPRHADALIVTGPVPENMRVGLLKTYEATPSPKLVIACGSCAIGGGPFRGHAEVHDGVDSHLPVDLYIPGCPPHPLTILDGLLRLLGRSD